MSAINNCECQCVNGFHTPGCSRYDKAEQDALSARARERRNDSVNHPSHYQSNGMEAIDVIEAFGLSFATGNALKYILRAGRKDDAAIDLRKAVWYLQREIERLE